MTTPIFRQAALDRLASPEGFDRPVRLVRPSGWLALVLLIAVIAFAIGWSFYARAPVRIMASGIVLPEGGLKEIVADTNGQIDELFVRVGSVISEGDSVATFQRLELQRELDNARAELADARARFGVLTEIYRMQDVLETRAENERLATINYTQTFVTNRRDLLQNKKESINRLVQRKMILQDRLIEVDIELTRALERIAVLDDEAKLLELRRAERKSKQRLALIDEELKAEQLARLTKRLELRLADNRVLRSVHTGQIIEIKVNKGDVVQPGMAMATLAPVGSTAANPAVGIVGQIYLSPAEGKRIRPGMIAEIEPSTARREEYGFILAKIVSVSSAPATIEGMRSTLKNEQLVSQLSGGGAPYEARISFLKDANTPSGLKWSSSEGPPEPLLAGTLLRGRIIVGHIPVIDMVVPGISKRLGLGND